MVVSQRSLGSSSNRGSAAPSTSFAADAKCSKCGRLIRPASRNHASRGEAIFQAVPACRSGASGKPADCAHRDSKSSNVSPESCSSTRRSPSRRESQAPARRAGNNSLPLGSSAHTGIRAAVPDGIRRLRIARLRTVSRVSTAPWSSGTPISSSAPRKASCGALGKTWTASDAQIADPYVTSTWCPCSTNRAASPGSDASITMTSGDGLVPRARAALSFEAPPGTSSGRRFGKAPEADR